VIYAIAHVRGGGELGKPWHDAGACTKSATRSPTSSPLPNMSSPRAHPAQKLIIEAGAPAGLLMGSVANMRPDLFACNQPCAFRRCDQHHARASLPLTVGEYEEWGNPRIARRYTYMKSYDPYFEPRAQKRTRPCY